MRTGIGVFLLVGGLLWPAMVQAESISEETRCKIVKLKASVKELKDKAQCYERSFKANVPVSGRCLERAEYKRARLYERAEQRGGCTGTGEGTTIAARIDDFLRDTTQTLEPSPKSAKDAGKEDAKKEKTGPEATASTETDAENPDPGKGKATPAPKPKE